MKTYIDTTIELIMKETNIKSIHLAKMYALLVLTKGENITLKDVHDAWAMDMNFKPQTNYCYGHEHKSIVPFEQLDKEVQNKDQKFVSALIRVAKKLKTI